jgi:hypothetical protein
MATTATPEQNATATWENLLQSWRIELTPEVESFIKQAVDQGWSSALFLRNVRATKFYARQFPGIFTADGSLRQTEAQYIAGYNTLKDYAATVGRGFSLQAYGMALKNGNSPSEIKAKIQAVDSLKTNPQMWNQFSEYIQAQGLAPKGGVTKSDLLGFVMQQGPKEWEDAWQTAYNAAQLQKLQIDVGKPSTGSDLSYNSLLKLEHGLLPGQQPDYTALAAAAKELPISALYGAGLTAKKITTMAFGGKGAAQTADVVQRVLAQYSSRFDPQAQPQLYQGGMAGGPGPTQATE